MLAQLSEIYCSIVVTITTGGLRVGDFQRLKPEHLVHNTCTIIVPGEKSDSSAAPVSVHQIYWPFLQLAISAPLKRSAIAKLLNRACTAAGISRIRVHDLRHCLGHYAAEGGATREELREALRHRSSNMTDIYVGRPTLVNTAVAMARSLEAGDDVGLAVVQRTKETPSRPSSRFDGMTRVELYEMVWRTPITHVAKRLGVSDILVHKHCRKHNIPTPPRGYWQRKQRGQEAVTIPLPADTLGVHE